MTDNQTNQMFDLLTKCVSGIQELKSSVDNLETSVNKLEGSHERLEVTVNSIKDDVAELKNDVNDLKEGQNRIEKQMRLNDAAVDSIAGEQLRLKSAITNLEKPNV